MIDVDIVSISPGKRSLAWERLDFPSPDRNRKGDKPLKKMTLPRIYFKVMRATQIVFVAEGRWKPRE
jgi:hypothetical protein